MGQLIFNNDFKVGESGKFPPSWYFPDFTNHGSSFKWTIRSGFPYFVVFHKSVFEEHPDLRITIRKWIEQNISSTVIFKYIDLEYKHVWNKDAPRYEHLSHTVCHGYYAFFFENEADALFFTLAFGELVDRNISYKMDSPPSYRYESAKLIERIQNEFGITLENEEATNEEIW